MDDHSPELWNQNELRDSPKRASAAKSNCLTGKGISRQTPECRQAAIRRQQYGVARKETQQNNV
jgi:hypothetical protein